MNKHTHKLHYPFEVNGQKITEISLRRPKLRDIKQMEKMTGDDFEKSEMLLVNLSEQPPEIIEELDVKDYTEISKIVEDWMGNSPAG